MILFQLTILVFVAVSGTLVVFARDPLSQPIGISFFGLVLAVMFMAFQAPDVALSQIVIGTVGLPLMILLALARMRRDEQQRTEKQNVKSAPETRS
jgi:energy-converting hydrogenase B subunit D